MKKDGHLTSNEVHYRNEFLMNTSLDIIVWGVNQELADSVFDRIIKLVVELEMILSRFNPKSETFHVNQNAWKQPVRISALLAKLIQIGVDSYHLSKGYFNIFAGNNYKVEDPSCEKVLLEFPLPDISLSVENKNECVKFLNEHISLDFGGIGKGFALDQVSKILEQMAINNAFISFGGSSVLTRGHHPHGKTWPFSFQDEGIMDDVWHLNDDVVSISSNRGLRKNTLHIIRPKGGKPGGGIHTAAVRCDSATDAEVLSTALVASSSEEHEGIVGAFNVKTWWVA